MYDIIVIGAGPAGISASIYAVSRGLKTLVIEKDTVGGLIGKVSTVTHYTGIIQEETGETFAARMLEQAENAGVEFTYESVEKVHLTGDIKQVATADNIYEAKKVIIANGTSPRLLNIPGEAELSGKGMRMNASFDGPSYEGKNVYVVGGADGAIKEAIYLANLAKSVTIIHFEEKLGCIAEFLEKIDNLDNINLCLNSRLHSVHGEDEVSAIEIIDVNSNEITKVDDQGCGIFVYAGATPNTGLYKELELENGFIKVDDNMLTSIPGVYAVGDIRAKKVRQVATAVNDGAIAAIHAASN